MDPTGDQRRSVTSAIHLVLLVLLAPGGCSYDMDSVPFEGGVEVSTIAGTGTQGNNDGAAVAVAQFWHPVAVAVDHSNGKVYVADSFNHVIRLVHKQQVSTFAGSGKPGYLNGAASSARFLSPMGVALGPGGRIFVADTGNHRIRVIHEGKVSLVAGMGPVGGKGGFADGGAAAARFNLPRGLVVDSAGRVFVADSANHNIRTILGGQVSTFAGAQQQVVKSGDTDGTHHKARFKYPSALALDQQNQRVFVADSGNHKIRLITSKEVTTFAGSGNDSYQDGDAAGAQFNAPLGVAFCKGGAVLVADSKTQRIRKILAGQVSTLAGEGFEGHVNGPGDKAHFDTPEGLACDGKGSVHVADRNNHRIRLVSW